jgi:Ca-activated chloride channel family protein
MSFQDPIAFILIPLILMPLFIAHLREDSPGIRFPDGESLIQLPGSNRTRCSRQIIFLRALSLILITIALARPQQILEESKVTSEGVDMVLSVDISSSMLAEDFNIGTKRLNRIEAAKAVINDFVRNRRGDRIGMVLFAAKAYMICPLTLDYDWLLTNLERAEVGLIEDNTAIGSGLSSALNRLKTPGSRGKAVILLTDGRNNAGRIAPEEAAAAAKALNVKVYTIGIGSKGPAPYPAKDPFGKKIYRAIPLDMDEGLLIWIASKTGAKYFRATDITSLKDIFQEIDQIEKTPIEEKIYYSRTELFHLFLIPGLVLLGLELILRRTILRRIP